MAADPDKCVPTGVIFRHNFNLEASDSEPSLGFDGGVLELSTDGGNTLQDVLAAGGSFAMGGYNRTISTPAWEPHRRSSSLEWQLWRLHHNCGGPALHPEWQQVTLANG